MSSAEKALDDIHYYLQQHCFSVPRGDAGEEIVLTLIGSLQVSGEREAVAMI